MKRFVATFFISVAAIMVVAMMVLPHHHHHEFLVIAHYDCGHAAEHDADHHSKDNCELDLFISSIVRDDMDADGNTLLPVEVFSFLTLAGVLSSNWIAPPSLERLSVNPPPFCESLFTEYASATSGLRAPPCLV